MQGICLIGVFLLWPSLTLYINRAQLWAWFVFPPVQILNWLFWAYVWKSMMDAQGKRTPPQRMMREPYRGDYYRGD
jgi:hypothetical protein